LRPGEAHTNRQKGGRKTVGIAESLSTRRQILRARQLLLKTCRKRAENDPALQISPPRRDRLGRRQASNAPRQYKPWRRVNQLPRAVRDDSQNHRPWNKSLPR